MKKKGWATLNTIVEVRVDAVFKLVDSVLVKCDVEGSCIVIVEALVEEMHGRDIKVIMDFIPNHSSEEHEWFQKSVKKEEPYTDYYVWADGKNGEEIRKFINLLFSTLTKS